MGLGAAQTAEDQPPFLIEHLSTCDICRRAASLEAPSSAAVQSLGPRTLTARTSATAREGLKKWTEVVAALIVLRSFDARKQNFGKAKLGKIAHSHGVELAYQVVAFMLNDSGVKTFGNAIYWPSIRVESAVANA